MCVINAHARSNRQMHGRIQCIWYYFCLLEETKEIALIVAVLSFDIKQIKKKKKKQRHQNIYKKKQFIACFRSSETERDCKDTDEMEPLEENVDEEEEQESEAWAQGFMGTIYCWRSGWYNYY